VYNSVLVCLDMLLGTKLGAFTCTYFSFEMLHICNRVNTYPKPPRSTNTRVSINQTRFVQSRALLCHFIYIVCQCKELVSPTCWRKTSK